jgi:hypothetical protein
MQGSVADLLGLRLIWAAGARVEDCDHRFRRFVLFLLQRSNSCSQTFGRAPRCRIKTKPVPLPIVTTTQTLWRWHHCWLLAVREIDVMRRLAEIHAGRTGVHIFGRPRARCTSLGRLFVVGSELNKPTFN